MTFARQYLTSLRTIYAVYRNIIEAGRWLSARRAITGAWDMATDYRDIGEEPGL